LAYPGILASVGNVDDWLLSSGAVVRQRSAGAA